jgi:hypothetical protein
MRNKVGSFGVVTTGDGTLLRVTASTLLATHRQLESGYGQAPD